MKIKIIDILNTIANGEEPPTEISYEHKCYKYEPKGKNYYCFSFDEYLFDSYVITDILNDEVEIIQITITHKQDKKIEKVSTYVLCDYDFKHLDEDNNFIATNIIDKAFEEYSRKINEIIDKVNDL